LDKLLKAILYPSLGSKGTGATFYDVYISLPNNQDLKNADPNVLANSDKIFANFGICIDNGTKKDGSCTPEEVKQGYGRTDWTSSTIDKKTNKPITFKHDPIDNLPGRP
jgi:hypothetical protein